jgi:hypothetical protein
MDNSQCLTPPYAVTDLFDAFVCDRMVHTVLGTDAPAADIADSTPHGKGADVSYKAVAISHNLDLGQAFLEQPFWFVADLWVAALQLDVQGKLLEGPPKNPLKVLFRGSFSELSRDD